MIAMILDSGIASVYNEVNMAADGDMPVYGLKRKAVGWYGQRNFSSAPSWLNDQQERITVSKSIRMLRNERIATHDIVVLMDAAVPPDHATRFTIVRIYHGVDDDNGSQITDIDLEVVHA